MTNYLRRMLEVFFRHWMAYVALLVLCIGLGSLNVLQTRQSFTATGSLFVEPRTLLDAQSGQGYADYLERLTAAGFVTQDLESLLYTESFTAAVAKRAGFELSEFEAVRDLEIFQFQLAFEVETASENVVRISATTLDPEESRLLAEAAIEQYIEFQAISATAQSASTEEFYDGVLEALAEDLVAARQEVDRFLGRLPATGDPTPEQEFELDQLRETEAMAEAAYRTALEGFENTQLGRTQNETMIQQRFSFVDRPAEGVRDASGDDAYQRIATFVLIGLVFMLMPPVVVAARSRTVLVPADLTGEIGVPVLASVPLAPVERLAIDAVPSHSGRSGVGAEADRPIGDRQPVAGGDHGPTG